MAQNFRDQRVWCYQQTGLFVRAAKAPTWNAPYHAPVFESSPLIAVLHRRTLYQTTRTSLSRIGSARQGQLLAVNENAPLSQSSSLLSQNVVWQLIPRRLVEI